MDFDYDLFVIGAGSGGVRAARVAAGHGARVAIAEEFRVGGTCVIRGCVPKKLLVYGSHFAEDLSDARRFGWMVPDCDFDWKVLRDNVLAEVDRLEGIYGDTLGNAKVETIRERAVVTGREHQHRHRHHHPAAHATAATHRPAVGRSGNRLHPHRRRRSHRRNQRRVPHALHA